MSTFPESMLIWGSVNAAMINEPGKVLKSPSRPPLRRR